MEVHDVKVRSLRPLAAALGVLVGGATVEAQTKAPTSTKSATTTKMTTPTKTAAPSKAAPTVTAAKSTAMPSPKPATPALAPANQKLVEAIADRLSMSGAAAGADVSLMTEEGVVTVTGMCASPAQKQAILQDVRVVPGVKVVRDGLTVGSRVMQAQAAGGPVQGGPGVGVPPGPGGPGIEPMPLGHPGMGPGDGFAPPLPPYAWPTYAPHNNVSRVAYPEAYPYNAFPFIGPFYPFPKVPLGWRSVTLEWEDGHWWMGRRAVAHDFWRVRFW
jgi:hypothetical protein